MTQIVDERLKKMCDECHSHLDKPCAWLSLGNEYCEEIMNIQQELQRKDNIINELKDIINRMIYMGYCAKTGEGTTATNFMATGENSEFGTRAKYILDKIEELEERK